MIRNLSGITILALVLLLTGCGGNEAVAKVVTAPIATEAQEPTGGIATPAQAVTAAPETPEVDSPTPPATASPTEAPTQARPTIHPTEAPTPDVYFADGERLYRKHNGEDLHVYVVAPHFPSGWTCRLNNLLVEDGVPYFTEEGIPGDDYTESLYRIIRIDGYGRTVLDERRVSGYTQLVPYGDRIFFVQDGSDSQEIGWANKDGSASAYLDFSDYAAQYGVLPYYNGAEIYMKDDGTLYADIAFFTDSDPEIAEHTISISENLKIKRID